MLENIDAAAEPIALLALSDNASVSAKWGADAAAGIIGRIDERSVKAMVVSVEVFCGD